MISRNPTITIIKHTEISDPSEPGVTQRKNAMHNKKKKILAVFSFFVCFLSIFGLFSSFIKMHTK
jgi:hypothetical protein